MYEGLNLQWYAPCGPNGPQVARLPNGAILFGNPNDAVIIEPQQWREFVRSIKEGGFDLPEDVEGVPWSQS